MKINNKKIDTDLFFRYVKLIQVMEKSRGTNFYAELNIEREKLHTEILKEAGTTREDKTFNFALAEIIENLIYSILLI